jgi:hypothetical protein
LKIKIKKLLLPHLTTPKASSFFTEKFFFFPTVKGRKKNSYLLQQVSPTQAIKASSFFTQDFFYNGSKVGKKKILSFATVFTNPDLVGCSYVFVLGFFFCTRLFLMICWVSLSSITFNC